MSYLFDEQGAREHAISLIKQSLEHDIWEENSRKVALLRAKLDQHPLFEHPMIRILSDHKLPLTTVQTIHLEYQHSIVEVFTDALLMTQFQAKQLDSKLFSSVKMYARFLITYNILDEFGFTFQPNQQITPINSHFCLFKEVLNDLNISEDRVKNHPYAAESNALRDFLEKSYDNYAKLALLLAVGELQVIAFSPPLRKSFEQLGFATNKGYYQVHGVTQDIMTQAADDLHEDDLWILLTQALNFYNAAELEQAAIKYCDLWEKFWDRMQEIVESN